MANPSDLNYCKIIGNFKAFIADSGDDDDLPDFVPMSGDGQIWPNITLVKNTDLGFKSTYFNSPISVSVDADGDLSQGGRKYVMVLAGSGALNPSDFNYSISLSLSAQGESTFRSYGPFAFNVTPGGTVDLTDVLPVSTSGGTPIIQGPAGPEGPEGPMGPAGAGVPAGGSALQLIRKDSTNTTTEWVTPDKTVVGLNNVDNTSDLNKPVSTATQTALNLKVDASAKGAANGVATLDATSRVASAQMPVTYVPKWTANTAYASGQQVVSPNNDVVSAKAAFTSGATFDPTKWNLSSSSQSRGVVARVFTSATTSGIGTSMLMIDFLDNVTLYKGRHYRLEYGVNIQSPGDTNASCFFYFAKGAAGSTGTSGSSISDVRVLLTAPAVNITTSGLISYTYTPAADETVRIFVQGYRATAGSSTWSASSREFSITDMGIQF